MNLFDAHNHLQDERLNGWRAGLLQELPQMGVREMVVNGSSEEDWEQVAELARTHEWVRPAFGLHPWYVKQRSSMWREVLEEWLLRFPAAVVGEVGLDRWIADPEVAVQVECFKWQLDWAARHGRALTVHCLRAFGLLDEVLRDALLPAQGFLLHSYGGPAAMVAGFVKKGAYFSVSPYFAHERKRAQFEVFKAVVPLDRLLIETDAPDMWPPMAINPNPLRLPQGEELNSPVNLRFCYEMVAELRGLPLEELEGIVEANYQRLFGNPCSLGGANKP